LSKFPVYARITGPIVMVGFGSIGKGTLPMIERHLDYDKSRITVIDPKDEGRKAHCEKHNVRFIQQAVTKDNYRELLTPLLTEGGGRAAYPWLHRILVVDTPAAVQKARLMQRDGIDATLADQMMAAQASRAERLALADDIVVNDGDLAHLQRAAYQLHARYVALACSTP